MRCLLCGNPLSVLQKLTDADFCSNDHRTRFLDEQQRLILQRLQQSAVRLEHVRKAAVSKPKPAEPTVEAPAPLAAFCLGSISPADVPAAPVGLGPLEIVDLLPALPALPISDSPGAFCKSLFPDLPWPRYNPGLWSFHQMDTDHTAECFEASARVFASWSPLRHGWCTHGRIWRGRPDPIAPARRTGEQTVACAVTEVTQPEKVSIRLPHFPSEVRIPFSEKRHIPRPRLIGLKPRMLDIAAEPVGYAAPGPSLPRGYASIRQNRELGFLDRVFRMRPRGAVLDKSLPSSRCFDPEPLPVVLSPECLFAGSDLLARPSTASFIASTPVTPEGVRAIAGPRGGKLEIPGFDPRLAYCASAVSDATAFEPQPSARFFRARFRGPVSSERSSAFITIPPEPAHVAASALVAPHQIDPEAPEPRRNGDMVRLQSLGTPVADRRVSGLAEGAIEAKPLLSKPVAPEASVANCEPRRLDRFFRPRPRGPMNSGDIADCERIGATAEVSEPEHRFPAREPQLPHPVPAHSGRLSENDSRSGTPDSRLRQPRWAIEPLISRAVGPSLCFTTCAPPLINRFYRAKPRGPVFSGQIADCEPVQPTSLPFEAQHAFPSPESDRLHPAPAQLDRLIRMRPRSGVADPELGARLSKGVAAEISTSRAVSPALPRLECEPGQCNRFVRVRPRGPVLSNQLPLVQDLQPAFVAFAGHCTIPSRGVEYVSLNPAPVARLYRMRPRAGVADPKLSPVLSSGVAAESPTVRPSIPHPAVLACVPRQFNRFARPMQKGAVSAANLPTFEMAGIGSLACDPSAAKPSCQFVIPECQVKTVERLFRFRPRQGASRDLGVEKILPAPEPSLIRPVTVSVSLAECSPRELRRLFRPRPQAVNRADTLLKAIKPLCEWSSRGVRYATFGKEALGHLAPDFVNRAFRIRPKRPRQDESTLAREIRCRQLPVREPEPLRGTLPAELLVTSGPNLLEPVYQMRPRTGNEVQNPAKSTATAAVGSPSKSDRSSNAGVS